MEDKNQKIKDERFKKLIELQNEEKEIRRQRNILQRQQPWYVQPSNVIAVLAIVITIFFSLYSIFKSTEKLELTCVYSDPKPLTNFSPALQDKIALTFAGIPASNIGKITFKLTNTGTRGLRKDDFVDGPIDFKIQSSYRPNKIDSTYTVPFLLDIRTISNSKQKNDILKLNSKDRNARFSYLPSLINKNDVVEFEVYISDINNVKISVEGNIANGKIISEKYAEKVDKSNFIKAGELIINIFGSKWGAFLITLVLFLLSLLKSLIIMSEIFQGDKIDIIFGTFFIFIDCLFIILMVSIAIN